MRICYKLKISILILRDASEFETEFESKEILEYWDLKISLSTELKRFLSAILFLKMI